MLHYRGEMLCTFNEKIHGTCTLLGLLFNAIPATIGANLPSGYVIHSEGSSFILLQQSYLTAIMLTPYSLDNN
jgi:hypothetical protein